MTTNALERVRLAINAIESGFKDQRISVSRIKVVDKELYEFLRTSDLQMFKQRNGEQNG